MNTKYVSNRLIRKSSSKIMAIYLLFIGSEILKVTVTVKHCICEPKRSDLFFSASS